MLLSKVLGRAGPSAETDPAEVQRRAAAAGLERLKRLGQRAIQQQAPDTDDAVEPQHDGRGAPRKSSIIGGTIVSPSMTQERPCKVVDMSATGARIRLMPTADGVKGLPAGVPDEFTLVLKVDRVEVDCVVAWRQDREMGVRYKGVPRPIRAGR